MGNEIIFTSKEELNEYNTKLLMGFVEYLNNQHMKTRNVFHCGASVQIIDKEKLVKDFTSKLNL